MTGNSLQSKNILVFILLNGFVFIFYIYKYLESDFVLFIIMLSGFFTDIACPWNKPAVMAYRYYLHTHHNGKYERDVLVYSNEAILEYFSKFVCLK